MVKMVRGRGGGPRDRRPSWVVGGWHAKPFSCTILFFINNNTIQTFYWEQQRGYKLATLSVGANCRKGVRRLRVYYQCVLSTRHSPSVRHSPPSTPPTAASRRQAAFPHDESISFCHRRFPRFLPSPVPETISVYSSLGTLLLGFRWPVSQPWALAGCWVRAELSPSSL